MTTTLRNFMGLLVFFFLFHWTIGMSEEAGVKDELVHEESPCLALTIETALKRALTDNRQIISSLDNYIKAEYGISLAESDFDIQISPNGQAGYVGGGRAGTGPSVGGGLDFSKKFTTGTIVSIGPNLSKINKHYHSTLKALISQPLLRGFGRDYQLAPLKSAQFAFRSAQRALYIAQLQLVTRTIQALYEVIKAQKAAVLQRESHERIKKFYQTAKVKERMGLSDALDVYRAEIEWRRTEDDLTSCQERLQESEDALRDLLALPLDTCIQVDVPIEYAENNFSLEEALKVALENRIEIEQAEDQWKENYRQSCLAKKNLLPDLNMVFNYSNYGHDEIFTRCARHRESVWGVGFTTSSDFDPLRDRVAYEQSLMAIKTAERGIEQIQATISLEVRKAIRHLNRVDKRIENQTQQIQTAQGELYLSQLKFDRGMADNFNVIQAEKSLRSAQLNYWNAIIDRIVGEFQFLSAIGRLTDKPNIK